MGLSPDAAESKASPFPSMPGSEAKASITDSGRALTWTIALLALATFTYIYLLTHRLFVFSEARYYIHWPQPGDLLRFFVFPEPNWGSGRLLGIATFQVTGQICSVDAPCVNGVGALLTSAASIVLTIHTRQVTGSLRLAAAIGVLWVMSPPVLGISLWQSARFDMLAFIASIGTSALWWEVLGRRSLSKASGVVFVVASVVLIAVAFNAKELSYYLLGALPIIATIRGWSFVGGVRRNLTLSVGAIGYAIFFIAYALSHIAPDYAASAGSASILDTATGLMRQSLGLGQAFMGIWQPSTSFDALQRLAKVGYLTFLIASAAAGIVALRHLRRGRASELVRSFRAEMYLAAVLGATLIINSRSAGADVYYMPIPYWALLVLGALILRRVAFRLPASRLAFLGLSLLFATSALTAYASHFTARSAWQVLTDASARMDDVGATLRVLLANRDVTDVSWLTIGRPNGFQYVLRGSGERGTFIGPEMWPWLMRDPNAKPVVHPVVDGSAASWAARAAEFGAPGQVLVVLSQDYHLELLIHEGEVLFASGGG